jgi:hypothetical protein
MYLFNIIKLKIFLLGSISFFYSLVAFILRLLILNSDYDFPLLAYWNLVIKKILFVGVFSCLITFLIDSLLIPSVFSLLINIIVSNICIVVSVFLFGLDQVEKLFVLNQAARFIRVN